MQMPDGYLPIKLLDQHTIFLGKTRSGKSFGMRVMIEMLLDAKRRVCIIDPKGDHWGIKSSADGKKPGYPVVLFGDFKEPGRADVPINPRSGKEVAELVAEGNRPCVIGFRGWMPGDRTRFWIEFAATLFNKNGGALWLVIDEVHNFCPKGKVLDPDVGKSLHWTNRLASEGLGMGIRLVLASQRPQKVHNDTLTSAETLVAMRVIHASDRAAIQDWIDGCGDLERGKMVIGALAGMKRGEAFVWCPEMDYFQRLTFPHNIRTFDSYKEPGVDERKTAPVGWAEVDLEQVKKKLAAAIEEKKANDPAELRKQLMAAKLQVEELMKKPGVSGADVAMYEKRLIAHIDAVTEQMFEQNKRIAELIRARAEHLGRIGKEIGMNVADLHKIMADLDVDKRIHIELPSVDLFRFAKAKNQEFKAPRVRIDTMAAYGGARGAGKSGTHFIETHAATGVNPDAGDLPKSKAGRAIMAALQWWRLFGHESASREQVALIAGLKPTGGHYTNTLGSLRTAGLIEYPNSGRVALTEHGRKASAADAAQWPYDGKERIVSCLNSPQKRIFEAIWKEGREVSRASIAESAGFQEAGGHFTNSLGRLRTLTLVDYPAPGYVCLSEWVTNLKERQRV